MYQVDKTAKNDENLKNGKSLKKQRHKTKI